MPLNPVTPIIVSGFEEGVTNKEGVAGAGIANGWVSMADSVVILLNTTTKRSGGTAVQFDHNSANFPQLIWSTSPPMTGAGPVFTWGWAMYFAVLPTADAEVAAIYNSGGGGDSVSLRFESTDNRIHVQNQAGTDLFTVTKTLSAATWYLFLVEVDTTTSTWGVKLTITNTDGTGAVEGTGTTTASAAAIDYARIGHSGDYGTVPATNQDYFIDDLWMSYTSGDYALAKQWGPWNVQAMRLTSDGTHTFTSTRFEDELGNFKAPTDTDLWTHIDLPDLADETTFIAQNAIDTGYMECLFADLPASTDIPHGAWAVTTTVAGSTTGNMGTQVQSGPSGTMTNLKIAGNDPGITPDYYFNELTAPGGGWTRTNANDIRFRFGFGTSANPDEHTTSPVLSVLLFPAESGATLSAVHSVARARY